MIEFPTVLAGPALTVKAHLVARVTALEAGGCPESARELLNAADASGIGPDLTDALGADPSELPAPLRDVRDYTREVVGGRTPDSDRAARIKAQFGAEAFVELALCVAGSVVLSALNRALLKHAVGPA